MQCLRHSPGQIGRQGWFLHEVPAVAQEKQTSSHSAARENGLERCEVSILEQTMNDAPVSVELRFGQQGENE